MKRLLPLLLVPAFWIAVPAEAAAQACYHCQATVSGAGVCNPITTSGGKTGCRASGEVDVWGWGDGCEVRGSDCRTVVLLDVGADGALAFSESRVLQHTDGVAIGFASRENGQGHDRRGCDGGVVVRRYAAAEAEVLLRRSSSLQI